MQAGYLLLHADVTGPFKDKNHAHVEAQRANRYKILHMRIWVFHMDQTSNWAHGIPLALIRMGGQPSYRAVKGRLPHSPPPLGIVLQCWSRYNLWWILISAKQCSVPWEMTIGYIEGTNTTGLNVAWSWLSLHHKAGGIWVVPAGSLHPALHKGSWQECAWTIRHRHLVINIDVRGFTGRGQKTAYTFNWNKLLY